MSQPAQSSAPSPTTQTKGPDKGAAKAPAQTASQQKGPATKGGKAQEAKPAEEGMGYFNSQGELGDAREI